MIRPDGPTNSLSVVCIWSQERCLWSAGASTFFRVHTRRIVVAVLRDASVLRERFGSAPARGATEISALNAKADDPTCEHVHHHHDPMAAQEERFAAKQIDTPQAVLHVPDKAQPGRTIVPCSGSIVLRKHAADNVFVDIDAKGTRDLLCDAGTASTGIAALELDDRVDELLRWPLWARAPMTTRREKPPTFAFLERLVKSQQGSGLQDDRELGKSACRNEQGSKTQNEAIERIQVRRPPPRAAADDQLVL